jgi:hypothetical protein
MAGRKIEMPKTTVELYQERLKRIQDAIQLKIPDRVPIIVSFSYFPAKYTGITCEDAYYDYDKWLAAYKKTTVDFEPDMVFSQPFFPGKALEYLDPKQVKWPGHGISPYHSHQSIEGQFMEADEYDAFHQDFSDFMLRTYLPRTCGVLEPLSKLRPLSSLGFGYRTAISIGEMLADPEISNALEALLKTGNEMQKWRTKMLDFDKEIEKLGFPIYNQAGASAPFDVISDNLRGMRGAMLDMYRVPDKLLRTCDKLLPQIVESAVAGAKRSGNPRVFMALHRGSDGFMSLKQFETFYWPTLKKVILSLVDKGLTPCVFFEGDYTSRLEYLLELPKGKVLGHFDSTDIFKAKEVLNGHMCIRGNVPPSLLQTGTIQDVIDYCKKLIDVVGEDGGLIVSPRSSIDEVKPENLKAMIDFTKEYGIYS